MAPDLSFEEKIDYIYKELRWQKRTRFLNFIFKISIVSLLIFWAFNINKWFENETVIKKISSTLWTLVKPIVNDLVKDINSTDTIKDNELINNSENNDN